MLHTNERCTKSPVCSYSLFERTEIPHSNAKFSMKLFLLLLLLLFCGLFTSAQTFQPSVPSIQEAQIQFQRRLVERGPKAAFLEYLSHDAVIFQPDAVNGKQYWSSVKTEPEGKLKREMLYLDTASSRQLGYTTGNWEWTPKGRTSPAQRGQFVTVWAKRQGGQFKAVLDITTTEDPDIVERDDDRAPSREGGEANRRGWSAADPSMNFLKRAMGGERLGGAYSAFAAKEVRLLREGDPPIVGRKRVVAETEDYRSITYPKRVVLNESADMAYVWNPCEYADSDEGVERGHCLHIWKLRGKSWNITLGVLSRVRNLKKPELKLRPKMASKN